MPRRNKHNNYRTRGGNNVRGRGRGRGRGGSNHTTGSASGNVVPNSSATDRAPRHRYPHTNTEIDVVIQQWPESLDPGPAANGAGNAGRGNGPWRGGTPKSRSGAGTPRGGRGPGRGRGLGRGYGRGRGLAPDDDASANRDIFNVNTQRRPHFGVGVGRAGGKPNLGSIIGKDAPLSHLLYAERPLLRPVKFVRATLTPFLFQHSEDVLKSASVDVVESTETSHVPTADRVARLFHHTGIKTAPATASNSDSESDDHDVLEEIDFVDLARMRAEVDAIAATMSQDIHKDDEDIEEVDFADLGTLRAKIDAALPPEVSVSRDEIIEETFTGVYNRIKDTMPLPGDKSSGAQQAPSLSTSTMHDDLLHPQPAEILDISKHESDAQTQNTIVIEEDSFDALPDIPIPGPLPSIGPTPVTITLPTNDTTLHSAAPPHGSHTLFVVDTTPTHPLTSNIANDVILVDRAGHGETLGDQDEERIVYVAPHPRSRYTSSSPASAIPPVELPTASMLTGRAVDAEVSVGGLRSPVREDDDGSTMPARRGDTEVGGAVEEPQLSLASLTLEPTTTSTATPTRLSRSGAARRARKKEARLQRERQRQNKQSQLGFGEFGAMMSEARLREEDAREKQSQLGFGEFGAMMSEARWREEDAREKRHPRWATRRRGDSDLDWGTGDEHGSDDQSEEEEIGDEVNDKVDALSDGLGGMEIDPDLELDTDAMQGFLESMSAEGSRFRTMDDIADEARLQQEDEEGLSEPGGNYDSEVSDEEEEEMLNVEEQLLIAESDGEELSEDSDDDGWSPRLSFQARLRKIREQSRIRYPKAVQEISDDEDEDEEEDAPMFSRGTRSANDEAFIARIQDLLEENSHILSGRDRKQTKTVFRHLHQGHVDVREFLDDPEYTMPVNKKNKGKGKQHPWHVDAELAAQMEAQWDKDRAKKAARKQERQQARLVAALDPLSVNTDNNKNKNKNKGGGASKKAMRAAARLDVEAALAIAPRTIVDVVSLEAQMRQLAKEAREEYVLNENADGRGQGEDGQRTRTSMALPPMDREIRKMVHEMAAAFGLKSVSKGKGAERYTTLFRTARTGVRVNEYRVKALLRQHGGRSGKAGKGGKGGVLPRHREGEEVGKEAPKIGESNVGFKMLASMGWSEGDRIGSTTSTGIEAPLTAVMKRSKLGLGATR